MASEWRRVLEPPRLTGVSLQCSRVSSKAPGLECLGETLKVHDEPSCLQNDSLWRQGDPLWLQIDILQLQVKSLQLHGEPTGLQGGLKCSREASTAPA
jgi:hypothetical protein